MTCRECKFCFKSVISPFSGRFDKCGNTIVTSQSHVIVGYCDVETNPIFQFSKCGSERKLFEKANIFERIFKWQI